MLKRKALILAIIIIVALLQCTALNYLQLLNNKPDILLILVVFFSLTYGQIYGLATGAFCGLLSEITSGLPAGTAIFTYSFGGFILAYLGKLSYFAFAAGEEMNKEGKSRPYAQQTAIQILICFIFSLGIYLSIFLYLQSSSMHLVLFNVLLSVILPASLYTAVVSPLIFRFLQTIFA